MTKSLSVIALLKEEIGFILCDLWLVVAPCTFFHILTSKACEILLQEVGHETEMRRL